MFRGEIQIHRSESAGYPRRIRSSRDRIGRDKKLAAISINGWTRLVCSRVGEALVRKEGEGGGRRNPAQVGARESIT